ncbi:MAG: winged helix-turn-helix transcriptional regulator [Elusimicrobia bacterium]|nr:winged helix-turn-helix transcriptional regulator [Elusimicrobiota bacterium]
MARLSERERARYSRMFHALSNPHRLAVYIRLASVCGRVHHRKSIAELRARVGELCRDLDIAPSTVSHHLKELREAGLIHMEREGQTVGCWVDVLALEDLGRFFTHVAPGG